MKVLAILALLLSGCVTRSHYVEMSLPTAAKSQPVWCVLIQVGIPMASQGLWHCVDHAGDDSFIPAAPNSELPVLPSGSLPVIPGGTF